MTRMREHNFDGLVGPTHNFGGLSPGNVASAVHEGQISNPRAAALQGLEKMRFVDALGVGQAVLPPQPRPSLRTLRRIGFRGSDEEVLARAAAEDFHLVRLCSSAAAMWAANAATVAPSCDAADGRVHLTPANLQQMFHRALEAETTTAVLRAIFADETRFIVHDPLPGGGQLADEGAANHTRLAANGDVLHLFAWGRRVFGNAIAPIKFPARQTLEASEAVARLHALDKSRVLFVQQNPAGIDAGAFHTDVLAVGNESFFMLHELAFVDHEKLVATLRARFGYALTIIIAKDAELPVRDAVSSYAFNSQVVTLPDGSMTIIAPAESRETPAARAFLERIVSEPGPVKSVHYLDLRESMHNGGGPACLRQRIPLNDDELSAIRARVLVDVALHADLDAWIRKSYRDKLSPNDLADPLLAREGMTALDELTRILRLGSVYDFQGARA